MTIHNFIRKKNLEDNDFIEFENNADYYEDDKTEVSGHGGKSLSRQSDRDNESNKDDIWHLLHFESLASP